MEIIELMNQEISNLENNLKKIKSDLNKINEELSRKLRARSLYLNEKPKKKKKKEIVQNDIK